MMLDLNDQNFFFFLLTRILKLLYDCLEIILNSIQNESMIFIKQKNFAEKDFSEYEELYMEEMQEIRKLCVEDMNKLVEKYLNLHFEKITTINVNLFTKIYYTCLSFTNDYKIYGSKIDPFANNYLNLQESKISILKF